MASKKSNTTTTTTNTTTTTTNTTQQIPSNLPNFKKWTTVYPNYINSDCKREEGRRTSIENSVKNPSLEEICRAAVELKLNTVMEREKGYPSEYFLRGRARILIKDKETGEIFNKEITNKTTLLIKLAQKIKENTPVRPEKFNPMVFLPLQQAVSTKEPKPEKKPVPQKGGSGKQKKNVNVV